MKKLALAVVTGAALLAGPAVAADLAVRPIAKAPAYIPPPVYNWSGFYIGVHGGGGWSRIEGLYDNGGNPGPIDLGQFREGFGILGGHAGLNWQTGMFVLGVEGDGTYAFREGDRRFNCTGACQFTDVGARVEDMWSLRGRFGIANGNWLFFGTAGFGQVGYAFAANQTPKVDPGPNGTIRFNRSGAVAGAGVEYGWGQFSFRVDYLHYFTGFRKDFGTEEIVDSNVGDFVRFSDVDVIRGSLNWRFNMGGPIAANY